MKNCVLWFDLVDHGSSSRGAKITPRRRSYPYRIRIGDVVERADTPSLDPYFKSSGVDTDTLQRLYERKGTDNDWVYFPPDSHLGVAFNDPEYYLPATWHRRMSRSEFEEAERKAWGPFVNGRALLIGKIKYDFTDPIGVRRSQTNRLSSIIHLDWWSTGFGVLKPSHHYNVRLKVQGEHYARRVPISHLIAPGRADRFLLYMGASKSSIHSFDLSLRYNGRTYLRGRPMTLELVVPRNEVRDVPKRRSPINGES